MFDPIYFFFGFILVFPFFLLFLLYATTAYIMARRAYNKACFMTEERTLQDTVKTAASLWSYFGQIWYGYEIKNPENIPTNGGLFIAYHAPLPIDMYLFNSYMITQMNIYMYFVGDRFLKLIPGLRTLFKVLKTEDFSFGFLLDVLKDNGYVGICPGGVREALFSGDHYKVIFEKRIGFCKLAINSNKPIIPIFSINGREAFKPYPVIWRVLRNLYETTRLPLMPLLGGLPVKLVSIIGEPIYPRDGESPEELQARTITAIEALIERYQRRPGRMIPAVYDRLSNRRF